MNCPTCQPQLSAFLDQELEPTTHNSIAAHVADCATCKAQLDQLAQLSAKLHTSLSALRKSAPPAPRPQPRLVATPPAQTGSGSRFAAVAAVLILSGFAWLAASGAFSRQQGNAALTETETARLYAAGSAALFDITAKNEFAVGVSTTDATRRFHFARGQEGAYLWQPTGAPLTDSTPFDRASYLAGSDGQELWVSAPREQHLPVDATQSPLPRRLSIGLAALSKLEATTPDALRLSLDADDQATAWLRADADTPGGPVTAWIELDRESGSVRHVRLSVRPAEHLDLVALDTPESVVFQFSLDRSTIFMRDMTARQAPLESVPLSEALWQLGYTPGTVLPPEAMENLKPEGSGYL